MRPVTTAGSSQDGLTIAGFDLTSTAFREGGEIPRRHTCDGENVSPELSWTGAPEGTAAFALIVHDPDAPRGDFAHWVVVDFTGSATGALPEGVGSSPDAPRQGMNDFGRIGYGGPCPPSGTHRYVFTLYALSEPLDLPGTPTAADVRNAVAGRVLAEARITGTYTRQRG